MPNVRQCIARCKGGTLFQFPLAEKDSVRRSKWLQAFGVEDLKLHLYACTNHFSPEMRCGRRLKHDAIPNINIKKSQMLPELEEHNYSVMCFKDSDEDNSPKHMARPGTQNSDDLSKFPVRKKKFDNDNLSCYNISGNVKSEKATQVFDFASQFPPQLDKEMENNNSSSYEKMHGIENEIPGRNLISALNTGNFSQVPPLLLIPLKVINPLQCNESAISRKKRVITDDRQVQTVRTLKKEKERDKEFYFLRQKIFRLESHLKKLKKELKTEQSLHYHIYAHGRLGPKGSNHCTEFAKQKRRKSY